MYLTDLGLQYFTLFGLTLSAFTIHLLVGSLHRILVDVDVWSRGVRTLVCWFLRLPVVNAPNNFSFFFLTSFLLPDVCLHSA